MQDHKNRLSFVGPLLSGSLIAAVIIELFFIFLLKYPVWTANFQPLLNKIQFLYTEYDRKVIQMESDCSVYDPEVTYTLKHPGCVFQNAEYKNTISVNRQGLRDTEESLSEPEIIALGDSYTMGWGVDQEKSFPKVLEKLTGRKVLNAGISSYGTAREMMLLKRLDKSKLKFLIVQYSSNDQRENESYLEEGMLKIQTRESYYQEVSRYKKIHSYYPGKYIRLLLFPPYTPEVYENDNDALNLLKILEKGVKENHLESTKIFVIDLNPRCQNEEQFLDRLRKRVKNEPSSSWAKNISIINVSQDLDPTKDCYVLDDHPNSKGHLKIAQALAQEILKTAHTDPEA